MVFHNRRSPAISVITGLFILTMRSEADFGRRRKVCACDFRARATAKIKGGCSHPSTIAQLAALASPFCALSLPLQAGLSVRIAHKKTPSGCLGFLEGWRSEADSNRCSSFCRAEPSHSAIGPKFPYGVVGDGKYTKTKRGGYKPQHGNVLSRHGIA